MARSRTLLLLSVLALATNAWGPHARAGDEDVKEEPKKVEEKYPEDTEIPKEPEVPEPTVGKKEPEKEPSLEVKPPEEVKTPDDLVEVKPEHKEELPVAEEPGEEEEEEPVVKAPPPKKRAWKEQNPDENIDYSRILDSVETADPGRGVLAPALGFRGYRPSMVAAGGGDRVPGFGGMIEYSWNRIGAGVCASYRSTKGEDAKTAAYGMMGLYGLYRWLPFDMSPYFLLGIEAGNQTEESTGGMLGGGVEARLYSGWTVLFGWTFHSTVRRGFLGGALGWSF